MKKIFTIILFLILVLPNINLNAAGNLQPYTPLEPIPNMPQGGAPGDLTAYLTAGFKILISLGGIFAVLMLTLAGVEYMVSTVPGVKKVAKERAFAAIFGLVLLAASYLILYTINPNLLTFNFNPPSSTTAPPGTIAK